MACVFYEINYTNTSMFYRPPPPPRESAPSSYPCVPLWLIAQQSIPIQGHTGVPLGYRSFDSSYHNHTSHVTTTEQT